MFDWKRFRFTGSFVCSFSLFGLAVAGSPRRSEKRTIIFNLTWLPVCVVGGKLQERERENFFRAPQAVLLSGTKFAEILYGNNYAARGSSYVVRSNSTTVRFRDLAKRALNFVTENVRALPFHLSFPASRQIPACSLVFAVISTVIRLRWISPL